MRASIIITVFFLVFAISAAFLIADKKDTEILIVNVTLASPQDNDASKIISQVDAATSRVKRMEIAQDTPLMMPGITVIVMQDMNEKSGWNSIKIPENDTIYGSYDIMVSLIDTIDKNRPVRILTRVIDPSGKEISVKATDLMVVSNPD